MTLINISETENYVEFDVLAHPKARVNAITGVHDRAVKISVTAPPDKGRANNAIVKLLSKLLKIPVSLIAVVSGASSRRKRVRIEGIKPGLIDKLVEENIR